MPTLKDPEGKNHLNPQVSHDPESSTQLSCLATCTRFKSGPAWLKRSEQVLISCLACVQRLLEDFNCDSAGAEGIYLQDGLMAAYEEAALSAPRLIPWGPGSILKRSL